MADSDKTQAQVAAGRVIKKVKEQGLEVEFESPEAEQELASNECAKVAAKRPHLGIRFTKIVPPGAGQ